MSTQERLRELFVYDASGVLLRKSCPRCGSENVKILTRHNAGYSETKFDSGRFLLHRLVWVFFRGSIPDGRDIDHINGDRQDNRIENLRAVVRRDNARNAARRSDNTSGQTGVTRSPSGKWRAVIATPEKNLYLGSFVAYEDAVEARKAAEVIHGYHSNHGRSPVSVN